MTRIKCKINPNGYFKKTNEFNYNILSILVPHQVAGKNPNESILSEDYNENAITNAEQIDIAFYRILVEKLNGRILKKKTDSDIKFIFALKGIIKYYYKRTSDEQKEQLLQMPQDERYDYFYNLGKEA